MKRTVVILLLANVLVLQSSGCGLLRPRRQPIDTFPVVFPIPPTKEQVIGAVNANTSRIRQLQSDVTISVQGYPSLRGDLALERPRRFRMRAGFLGLPGTGVDLGSNDESFWIWFEQSRPPGVYYARHDQFEQSYARQLIPIEPSWLTEALGVVELDPGGHHEGPYQRVAEKIEIHSRIRSPTGDMTKITVVHERFGWVLEQHIYDGRGQLVATSRASEHRYYPQADVSLPQHVVVQVSPGQPTQMSFRIDVGNYQINQLAGDPSQLWAMPQPEGFPLIDVTNPRVLPVAQLTPRFAPSDSQSVYDTRRPFRPRFRRVLR